MCRHCFIISIKPNVTGIYFVVLSYVSGGNLNPSLYIVSNWFLTDTIKNLTTYKKPSPCQDSIKG